MGLSLRERRNERHNERRSISRCFAGKTCLLMINDIYIIIYIFVCRFLIRCDVSHTKYREFARLYMGSSWRLSSTTQGIRTYFNGCHDGRDADILRLNKRNGRRKGEFLQHAAG